jgi:hypothetical protein
MVHLYSCLYVVAGFLALSTQTWTAHGNGLWTKCTQDSDCNGYRRCMYWDKKEKTLRCVSALEVGGGGDYADR